jgi:hypothetical protein
MDRRSSARRGRRTRTNRSAKKRLGGNKFLIYLLAISVLGAFLSCFFFLRSYWNGKDKLSVVINRSDGGIQISTFSPLAGEITDVIFPKSTEVEVARNLGVWKMESLWQLSENEDLAGKLVAETVVRHFGFPVYVWADTPAEEFTGGNFLSLIRLVFAPLETNLAVGDKVGIAFFSFRVRSVDKTVIDLSESSFLRKAVFVDGEEGYVSTGDPSQKLLAIFSDTELSKSEYKTIIRDATTTPGVAKKVGKVIEILGPKVVSIVKSPESNIDCTVYAKVAKLAEKAARIFSCQVIKSSMVEGDFDLEITLGREFAERF